MVLQTKMDDRLGEALHVLSRHAVGADMHSLLSAAVSGHPGGAAALGSISQVFGLASRLPGLVSVSTHAFGLKKVMAWISYYFNMFLEVSVNSFLHRKINYSFQPSV